MFGEHSLRDFFGRVEKLNQSIDWDRINTIFLSHYTIGTASEGAYVYPVKFRRTIQPGPTRRYYYINTCSSKSGSIPVK